MGDPRANDEVDPRLQIGRDGEVVHGSSNENFVCRKEFSDSNSPDNAEAFFISGVLLVRQV